VSLLLESYLSISDTSETFVICICFAFFLCESFLSLLLEGYLSISDTSEIFCFSVCPASCLVVVGLAGGCLWLLGSLSGLPSLAWPALLVSPLPSAWPGLRLLLVSGVSWSCSPALSSARGCSPVFAFSSRPRVSVLVSVSGFSYDLSLNA